MSHKWLSKRQVQDGFGVSERTLDRWVERGQLRAYRVGGRVRFKAEDVDAFAVPIPSAATR